MIIETFEQELHTRIDSTLNELNIYAADYNYCREEMDLNVGNSSRTNRTKFMISSNAIVMDDPELIHAAGTGDLQRVFALLCCEEINPNIRSATGTMALIQTVFDIHENLGIVELLLNQNADVNAVTTDGLTALMVAVIKGYKNIVIRLLKAGADIHKKDMFGYDAMAFAVRLNHDDIAELLMGSARQ